MDYRFDMDADDLHDAIDWLEKQDDKPVVIQELTKRLRASQPTTQPPVAESR